MFFILFLYTLLTFFGLLEILKNVYCGQRNSYKTKILEELKTLSEFPDNPAIIAPTIITEEIAFVTDIKGVCKMVLHSKQHNIQQKLKG